MIIISEIFIDRFRSCRKTYIKDLTSFSTFCGKNNSGKSNVLRALNLFFKNEIEPGVPLNLSSDCSAGKKEKKKITIQLKFSLDENVNIQKTIKDVLKKVPRDSLIRKEYEWDPLSPSGYKVNYFVNGIMLNNEDKPNVDKFLNLFNFRYITDDRTPANVLRENLEELKSDLKIRLSHKYRGDKKKKELEELKKNAFGIIGTLARDLFKPVNDEIKKADKTIIDVGISTTDDVTELINTAVYQFKNSAGNVLSEEYQGQGIQNLLLFCVLHLIDKNFYRNFGWKIATVWAIEEPEIFLHFDLENQLADYFYNISEKLGERFQLLISSHSSVFPQYASGHYFVSSKSTDKNYYWTQVEKYKIHEFLKKLEETKITNMQNLLTYYPNKKIVLVEGYIDKYIISALIKEEKCSDIEVFSIDEFVGDDEQGGESHLLNFLKANRHILSKRNDGCGVLAVFDWDVDTPKVNNLKRHVNYPNIIFQFDKDKSNPLLDRSFRGIERFYETVIIEELYRVNKGLIGDRGVSKTEDRYYADSGRYPMVKHELLKIVQDKGLDYTYFKELINQIHFLYVLE